ncbi:hypothetical protein KBI33_00970 [Candidatus Shapirobacteria bacterium]|nr:hypothetical protein [Candidatus Shapirobacteria bacterium]
MFNKIILAKTIEIAPSGGLEGLGPTAPATPTEVGESTAHLVSVVIGFFTLVAGLWFLYQLISGGYAYMSAGGNKEKAQTASQKMSQALIGLVIVVLAIFMINLLGYILGIDFLNIGKVIQNLTF